MLDRAFEFNSDSQDAFKKLYPKQDEAIDHLSKYAASEFRRNLSKQENALFFQRATEFLFELSYLICNMNPQELHDYLSDLIIDKQDIIDPDYPEIKTIADAIDFCTTTEGLSAILGIETPEAQTRGIELD